MTNDPLSTFNTNAAPLLILIYANDPTDMC